MFLAARYIWTFDDHESARAAVAKINNNIVVQELGEVEQDKNFIFLDTQFNEGSGHLILFTTPAGVELYATCGDWLSSTQNGAQMAYVDGCLDAVIKEVEEGGDPPIIVVFELTFQDVSIHRVLH